MRQAVVLGGFLFAVGLFALPAAAQETGSKVDHIDRVAGVAGPSMGFRAPEGVKVVSPGALLLASFDRNFDGKVTRDEIAAAAPGVFAVADRNKDGRVTGFEQTDWAASIGSQSDVLANGMHFDTNLDRAVTPEEFVKGLQRLLDEAAGAQATEIAFADLVKPLTRPDQPADARPSVIARPTQGGPQASPTIVGD